MPRLSTHFSLLLLIVAGLLSPDASAAQDGVGFRFAFGTQHLEGDLGTAFEPGVDAEFSILVPAGPVRVGGGAKWVSYGVVDARESWSQVGFHLLAGYAIPVTELLRPYAEARYTFRRLRPEGDRYFGGEEVLLGDFVSQGSGVEGVLGLEVILHPRLAIDLSGAVGTVSVSPDLSEEGFGPIDSGTAWRLHVGLTWFPVNGR